MLACDPLLLELYCSTTQLTVALFFLVLPFNIFLDVLTPESMHEQQIGLQEKCRGTRCRTPHRAIWS